MEKPQIHFNSLRWKDRTACGAKWDPETRNLFRSDPDRVTCPKCIANYAKEGIFDAEKSEE